MFELNHHMNLQGIHSHIFIFYVQLLQLTRICVLMQFIEQQPLAYGHPQQGTRRNSFHLEALSP